MGACTPARLHAMRAMRACSEAHFVLQVIVVQRLVQRHVKLLHMRGEAQVRAPRASSAAHACDSESSGCEKCAVGEQVHRVLDLADRPELLDAPRPSRDAISYDPPSVALLERDGAKAGRSSQGVPDI